MKTLAALLALALPAQAAAPAAPDVAVSSPSAPAKNEKLEFRLEHVPPQSRGAGPGGLPSVGVGAGIKDGPVLQTMLWGSGGAVAGSLAGPAGAVIGAAAGAVVGFLIGVFVVPRQTAVSSGATHQMRL